MRISDWSSDVCSSDLLFTGEILPEIIPDTLSSLVWTSDSRGLLYGVANDQWRTDNARLHWLGQPVESEAELFHEDDEGFRVSVGLTSSEKWIVIATGEHISSYVCLLPAVNPAAPQLLVAPRQPCAKSCAGVNNTPP